MSLFGLAFLLYFFKLSAGNGLRNNLRNADKKLYKETIKVERLLLKLRKYECHLSFLMKCRDANVYPKFVRFKNLKNTPYKKKRRYYRRILLDEIASKNKSIRNLKQEFSEAKHVLHNNTTWLKSKCISYTLNNIANKEVRKLNASLEKKLDKILADERTHNGIYTNPNVTITNLSSRTLTNDEHEVLKYGLKHGIATKPIKLIYLHWRKTFMIKSTGTDSAKKANSCETFKKQPKSFYI